MFLPHFYGWPFVAKFNNVYICMQQSILIQLQHRIFSFNYYIDSTSTRAIFVQKRPTIYFDVLCDLLLNKNYACFSKLCQKLRWNDRLRPTLTTLAKLATFAKHATLATLARYSSYPPYSRYPR